MLRRVRTRLSYANVIATLALFIALGGSSYAALTITGKQIKDGTVTGKDIKDRSLTAKDFKGLPAGPQGERGPAGPAGPQGPAGAKGQPGATNVRVVTGAWVEVNADAWGTAEVGCGPGERATGGSAEWGGGASFDVTGLTGGPVSSSGKPTGWSAMAYNRDDNNNNQGVFSIRATVICASP